MKIYEEIVLKRRNRGVYSVNGDMYLSLFNETLKIQSLENKLYLINEGTYYMVYTYSPKFKRYTWEIKVPNRRGIRIHAGNYYFHSKGCILLGLISKYSIENKEWQVFKSSEAVALLEEKLDKLKSYKITIL